MTANPEWAGSVTDGHVPHAPVVERYTRDT
jgi:hypothetical protein